MSNLIDEHELLTDFDADRRREASDTLQVDP